MQKRAWTVMLLAALGWGTGGVAARSALGQGLGPYELNAVRTVLAAVLVMALLAFRGGWIPFTKAGWRLGVVMGFTNLAIPFIVLTMALQRASAGFVGLLVALVPIVTAFFAHYLVEDEPMHLRKFGGLTIALLGVGVLLASGDSGLEHGEPVLAFALAAVGVISIGFSGALARARSGEYESVSLSALQFIVGAVVILPATLLIEGVPGGVTSHAWIMIGYLTVVSTVMPFLLYYWVLRIVSATKASLIGYFVPVFAVITGAVALAERLEPGIVAGGTLILVGVVVTDRLEQRRRVERA